MRSWHTFRYDGSCFMHVLGGKKVSVPDVASVVVPKFWDEQSCSIFKPHVEMCVLQCLVGQTLSNLPLFLSKVSY